MLDVLLASHLPGASAASHLLQQRDLEVERSRSRPRRRSRSARSPRAAAAHWMRRAARRARRPPSCPSRPACRAPPRCAPCRAAPARAPRRRGRRRSPRRRGDLRDAAAHLAGAEDADGLTRARSSPGLADDLSSFAMPSASVAGQSSGILRFGPSAPVLFSPSRAPTRPSIARRARGGTSSSPRDAGARRQ